MKTEHQSSTPAPAAPTAVAEPTPEQEMAAFTTEAYHDGVKVEKPSKEAAKVKEPAKEPAKADKEADSEDDKEDESEAETTEESAKSDDKEDADEADKEADKKKGLTAKQRVQQAIARQRTAEAARDADRSEVARLRAENEALRRGEAAPHKKDLTPAKEGVKGEGKPNPDDYKFGTFDDAYQSDLADFNAKRAFAKLEADRESTRQQEAEVAEATKFKTDMDSAMEKGAEKYGDFVEKVVEGAATEEWKLTKTVAHLAVKSEVGHEILYHLASNPKESEKVAKMSQVDQAVWFGRQETRFAAPSKAEKKSQQPPNVPPPPSNRPRGANGKFAVNADTNDFAAFEAKMKAEGEFS